MTIITAMLVMIYKQESHGRDFFMFISTCA